MNPLQDPIDPVFLDGYAETAEEPIYLTPSSQCRLVLYEIYLGLVWVAEAVPHGYLDGPKEEVAPIRQFYAGLGSRIAGLVETCGTFS